MNTEQFTKLIQAITGRDLVIQTTDENLTHGTTYIVYRITPLQKIKVWFKWNTAKTDDKMLKSFITAFINKYKEPNPAAYNKEYGGKVYTWDAKTPEEKEFAYYNHSSNMYHKDHLMKQIEANFESEQMQTIMVRYGFYATEYGVGIFSLFATNSVMSAINQMAAYLKEKSIPFSNEYSDARWVLRFRLNISKEAHATILNNFAA